MTRRDTDEEGRKQVAIRLCERTHRRVKAEASLRGMTMSAFISTVLEGYIAKSEVVIRMRSDRRKGTHAPQA